MDKDKIIEALKKDINRLSRVNGQFTMISEQKLMILVDDCNINGRENIRKGMLIIENYLDEHYYAAETEANYPERIGALGMEFIYTPKKRV